MTKWVENPGDNSDVQVNILPPSFNIHSSPCVICAGTLDYEWECTRCHADHWPAVQRLRKRIKGKN